MIKTHQFVQSACINHKKWSSIATQKVKLSFPSEKPTGKLSNRWPERQMRPSNWTMLVVRAEYWCF